MCLRELVRVRRHRPGEAGERQRDVVIVGGRRLDCRRRVVLVPRSSHRVQREDNGPDRRENGDEDEREHSLDCHVCDSFSITCLHRRASGHRPNPPEAAAPLRKPRRRRSAARVSARFAGSGSSRFQPFTPTARARVRGTGLDGIRRGAVSGRTGMNGGESKVELPLVDGGRNADGRLLVRASHGCSSSSIG